MEERALADLRRLAEQDASLAAEAGRLESLDAEIGDVRARASQIEAFWGRADADQSLLGSAIASAEAELERRREELRTAQADLERARDDDERFHAERRVERAVDHVAVAQAQLDRDLAALAEHERTAAALPEETHELEGRARELAAREAELPPAPDGTSALIDWCSHAHAELFVAIGQLGTQRERIIREANELASMLLGETTYGSTVAQALARVTAR